MKMTRFKMAALVLVIMLLCIGCFVTSVRPVIAVWTANQYIQRHYRQFDLPPAEIVSTGYREIYNLTWITDYGAQSLGSNEYSALIIVNGWFPFLVQESYLWKNQKGKIIQLDP